MNAEFPKIPSPTISPTLPLKSFPLIAISTKNKVEKSKLPTLMINNLKKIVSNSKDSTPIGERKSFQSSPSLKQIIRKDSFMHSTLDNITSYKFTLGEGNNHLVVRKVLLSRNWWSEIPAYNTLFNFTWNQTSNHIKYERLKSSQWKQMVNHFEFHKELSSKSNLLLNLQKYCEENKRFLFDIIPITFNLDLDNTEKFENEIQEFLNYYSSKSRLGYGNNEFSFLGKSSQRDHEKKNLLYSQPRNYSSLNSGHNVWIFKPADFNRGRGIKLFNKIEDFLNILQDYTNQEFKTNVNKKICSATKDELKKIIIKFLSNSKLKTRKFILQKYIEAPLLINERKFDIRVWVLLNQEMNVFFFREGYIRTSSEIFDLSDENLVNSFVHLTNNAIQKNSEKYGNFENGNQLSFSQIDRYFHKQKISIRMKKNIIPKMKEIITTAFKSVKNKINPNERKYCFEIFGFDFMIDSQFGLWLIEINTNPCLEESSPLLKQLIPRMLDDAFKLSLDKLFPKNKNKNKDENNLKNIAFRVNGYYDNDNLWELVTNIGQPNEKLKKSK